jgi:UDP-3-O-[3-hydroxymyristoyl] glucosamine N-acyltransferase
MNSIPLKDIISLIPEGRFQGNSDHEIESAIGVKEAGSKSITWVSDKNSASINSNALTAGLIILTSSSYEKLKTSKSNFLIVDNPRAAFFKVVKKYFGATKPAGIESTAVIHPSSSIGKNCYIGHHVVVEENCSVGENTVILHNTVVMRGTIIGRNVIIGCNNTIGNYGFGYEKDEEGQFEALEHIGNVMIHDNVEIHNNTCIDRGVMGNTILHENAKIDNLVHIAHGAIIGKNALVIANAVVAGSVIVGENSWIAPSVTIRNKAVIAPNTMTGIGSVIIKDTEANQTYIGNPATTMEEYKKWSEVRKKLLDDNNG